MLLSEEAHKKLQMQKMDVQGTCKYGSEPTSASMGLMKWKTKVGLVDDGASRWSLKLNVVVMSE